MGGKRSLIGGGFVKNVKGKILHNLLGQSVFDFLPGSTDIVSESLFKEVGFLLPSSFLFLRSYME